MFNRKESGNSSPELKTQGFPCRIFMNFYRLNIFDIILIALILLFSTGFILYSGSDINPELSKDYKAFFYQEGRLIKQLTLDKKEKINLLNGRMIVESEPGKIRVLKSDCSRNICVNTGWIKTPGRIITCVPNKILIEIKSEDEPFLDAVVN